MDRQAPPDLPASQLAVKLSRDIAELVQLELRLGRVELDLRFRSIVGCLGLAGVGGIVAFAGCSALMSATLNRVTRRTGFDKAVLLGAAVAGSGALLAIASLQRLRRAGPHIDAAVERVKDDARAMWP